MSFFIMFTILLGLICFAENPQLEEARRGTCWGSLQSWMGACFAEPARLVLPTPTPFHAAPWLFCDINRLGHLQTGLSLQPCFNQRVIVLVDFFSTALIHIPYNTCKRYPHFMLAQQLFAYHCSVPPILLPFKRGYFQCQKENFENLTSFSLAGSVIVNISFIVF